MDSYFYELRYQNDLTEWRAVARRAVLRMAWERYGRTAQAASPRILDVGCGTGVTMMSLAEIGPAWGMDASLLAVRFCRKRGIGTVSQAVVEALPFRDEGFGFITVSDVLEHISDDQSALKELHRICAVRGLLTIVVPAFPCLWSNRDERLQHRRRYTLAELRAKTEEAGFKVLKCTCIDSFLFVPLLILVRLGLLSGDEPTLRMDVAPRVPLLDSFWLAAARLERSLLRRLNLPLGVSALCVARKIDG